MQEDANSEHHEPNRGRVFHSLADPSQNISSSNGNVPGVPIGGPGIITIRTNRSEQNANAQQNESQDRIRSLHDQG